MSTVVINAPKTKGTVAITRAGWPVVWPKLEPEDFCKRSLSTGNGRHCMHGWLMEVIPNSDARYKAAQLAHSLTPQGDIVLWNDRSDTTKQQQAAMWEKIGIELGYTEPC